MSAHSFNVRPHARGSASQGEMKDSAGRESRGSDKTGRTHARCRNRGKTSLLPAAAAAPAPLAACAPPPSPSAADCCGRAQQHRCLLHRPRHHLALRLLPPLPRAAAPSAGTRVATPWTAQLLRFQQQHGTGHRPPASPEGHSPGTTCTVLYYRTGSMVNSSAHSDDSCVA